MPTFKDQESAYQLVPEGEYVLCVFAFSSDISTGQATNSAPRYHVVFNIEGTTSRIKDQLIDHPKCDWKIDMFLKAAGVRNLAPGLDFEFEKDKAEEKGRPWLNPMGLRCPASIVHEKYTTKRGNEITINKIAAYITDRPPLPPDPELRKKPTGSGSEFGSEPKPF